MWSTTIFSAYLLVSIAAYGHVIKSPSSKAETPIFTEEEEVPSPVWSPDTIKCMVIDSSDLIVRESLWVGSKDAMHGAYPPWTSGGNSSENQTSALSASGSWNNDKSFTYDKAPDLLTHPDRVVSGPPQIRATTIDIDKEVNVIGQVRSKSQLSAATVSANGPSTMLLAGESVVLGASQVVRNGLLSPEQLKSLYCPDSGSLDGITGARKDQTLPDPALAVEVLTDASFLGSVTVSSSPRICVNNVTDALCTLSPNMQNNSPNGTFEAGLCPSSTVFICGESTFEGMVEVGNFTFGNPASVDSSSPTSSPSTSCLTIDGPLRTPSLRLAPNATLYTLGPFQISHSLMLLQSNLTVVMENSVVVNHDLLVDRLMKVQGSLRVAGDRGLSVGGDFQVEGSVLVAPPAGLAIVEGDLIVEGTLTLFGMLVSNASGTFCEAAANSNASVGGCRDCEGEHGWQTEAHKTPTNWSTESQGPSEMNATWPGGMASSPPQLDPPPDLKVGGDLLVDGSVTVGGNIFPLEGSLFVRECLWVQENFYGEGPARFGTSTAEFGGNLLVQGTLRVGGQLDIFGAASVEGGFDLVAGKGLEVGENAFGRNAEVEGDARVHGNVSVGMDAFVGGSAELMGDLTSTTAGAQIFDHVAGNFSTMMSVMVGGDASFGGELEVCGDFSGQGNLNVSGNGGLGGDMARTTDIGGSMTIGGGGTVLRGLTYVKDVTVNAHLNVSQDLSVPCLTTATLDVYNGPVSLVGEGSSINVDSVMIDNGNLVVGSGTLTASSVTFAKDAFVPYDFNEIVDMLVMLLEREQGRPPSDAEMKDVNRRVAGMKSDDDVRRAIQQLGEGAKTFLEEAAWQKSGTNGDEEGFGVLLESAAATNRGGISVTLESSLDNAHHVLAAKVDTTEEAQVADFHSLSSTEEDPLTLGRMSLLAHKELRVRKDAVITGSLTMEAEEVVQVDQDMLLKGDMEITNEGLIEAQGIHITRAQSRFSVSDTSGPNPGSVYLSHSRQTDENEFHMQPNVVNAALAEFSRGIVAQGGVHVASDLYIAGHHPQAEENDPSGELARDRRQPYSSKYGASHGDETSSVLSGNQADFFLDGDLMIDSGIGVSSTTGLTKGQTRNTDTQISADTVSVEGDILIGAQGIHMHDDASSAHRTFSESLDPQGTSAVHVAGNLIGTELLFSGIIAAQDLIIPMVDLSKPTTRSQSSQGLGIAPEDKQTAPGTSGRGDDPVDELERLLQEATPCHIFGAINYHFAAEHRNASGLFICNFAEEGDKNLRVEEMSTQGSRLVWSRLAYLSDN